MNTVRLTSTSKKPRNNRWRSARGWRRESLGVEALERRVLLAADMTAAAPAAFMTSSQMQSSMATGAAVQNTSAGAGATFASNNPGDAMAGAPGTTLNPSGIPASSNPGDAGVGAPGTSFNPAGTPASSNPGDAGVGAPGTTFNPSGTPASANPGDAGVGAPGTLFNPAGTPASSNPGDAGPAAPGTTNPQATDAVFAGQG
jgi:hypothetical protein